MISATDVEREYITVTDMARESGQKLATVYNWLRYHRYFTYERVLGRTVARRAEWEEFKKTHSHFIRPKRKASNANN